ncbi:secreted frizzled-related protein 2 [Crotalus adamanteus]|uniref:Secreted frizzled-related protein 2 n=1 Tax=Crotalus adamanteus TaxID=8729 RepID=A0AAW1BBB9_CROAD
MSLSKMRPGELCLSAACLNPASGLFREPEFAYKRSNCKPIPTSLLLCHGIEYPDMQLPNLLGHEMVQEVLEQADDFPDLEALCRL